MFMSAQEYDRKLKGATEKQIQNTIREYLALKGWQVYRHHQSLGSVLGFPDLSAIKYGITIYIEVKKPKGKQSKHQKERQAEIEAAGSLYFIATGIEDVEEIIDNIRIIVRDNQGWPATIIKPARGMNLEAIE